MKPKMGSSPEHSNPDMETDGVGEYAMQNLNAILVTNTPPLNLGLNMENESSKEGSNEAYQNCRSPDDSSNVKHANNADSKDTHVIAVNLKVNEPYVLPTPTTRAPNNPNTHAHETKANPHNTPNLYQDPTSNTHPQTTTQKRLPRKTPTQNPSQVTPLTKKGHSFLDYNQIKGSLKCRLASQDDYEIHVLLAEAVNQPHQQP